MSVFPTKLDNQLAQAMQAAEKGNPAQARKVLRRLTRNEPSNIQAWLCRAAMAETTEERLRYLTVVLEMEPEHPGAAKEVRRLLYNELEDDAFVDYEGETDFLYHIRTAQKSRVVVPKGRRPFELYPSPEQGPLGRTWRWLRLALLGLAFAGLGAVVFGALAAGAALRAGRQPLEPRERREQKIAFLLAILIWTTGLALTGLLLLHL